MCGIIGFTSNDFLSAKTLINGLKSLEYRGYDSCGLAISNEKIEVYKSKGKVLNLENIINKDLNGVAGIAHTRWATHGEPTKENAHPHVVSKVTLVHNGIIENYDTLKEELLANGRLFNSETDTEVACAIINQCYEKETNKLKAIQMASKILEGSYAFGIIFEDEKDVVYTIRKDNPLILGISDNACFLASDGSAFLSHTKQMVDLEENQIGQLNGNVLKIYDEQLNEITYKAYECEMDESEIQKDGFDTFMMKEIHEEPSVVFKTMHRYVKEDLKDLYETMPDLSKYERFIFIGCGSAYYAGMIGKYLMERKAFVQSSVELASEFRYNNPIMNDKTAVVFISQSGETADTLAALRMCNEMNIDTFAVVNVATSSLAKEAKHTLLTLAGKEISVATTKAYLAQVCILSLFAIKKALQENKLSKTEKVEIEAEIKKLPKLLKEYLSNEIIEKYASFIGEKEHVFFIGRGLDYALSLEGSLKLKEISYIHAEAYAAGELKHGTISLIENDTPVIACITDSKLAAKTISNVKEVEARGAKILWLVREDLIENFMDENNLIKLPNIHSTMQAIISIIPYQLLAYYVAKKRGCDIDQPRNLAKSVTVE